ncbi:ERV/ALR sulfhydryl oxidase domain-containing protein [Mycena pura]|uniref:Sulfhydryl oxidase n=1 Tax=Mycena pura TaxID=153505 RepID=A0AAD6VUL6_9AGAR|nr:ERV/ALR sulfhydryl oxidase domain-containing protein [Mycena pura]
MLSRFAKLFVAIVVGLLLLSTITFLHPSSRTYFDPWSGELFGEDGMEQSLRASKSKAQPHAPILGADGGVIMSKLENATAKAELGRATWKLIHTMTLRYPEKPTQDERDALSSYFHLLSRLYPCGECAIEFQQLLKAHPPQARPHFPSRLSESDSTQTSSRRTASLWLCSIHNRVNERLGKEEFDCAHLDETYDCGCGDEPIGTAPPTNNPMDQEPEVAMMRGGR